ncbi:hypothetical protein Mmc1_0608 [Magnetococcus marinus MC-1]|uniref:Autotransporter domain-containing protein n=1 Tax=Magnetococcus marinus (strain ATCC BAA-1437 / JCM 17883 / MC-1) TaxID=156889 RepID=A0L586_MAGMM|nr:hypothetical protein [Magnetococcus marinus]ABK43129.1 hypothetical protein Mmc1_0608 [Magnetococcus marinus MC-1]
MRPLLKRLNRHAVIKPFMLCLGGLSGSLMFCCNALADNLTGLAYPVLVASQLHAHQDPSSRFTAPATEPLSDGLNLQPNLKTTLFLDGANLTTQEQPSLRLFYGDNPNLYLEVGRKNRPFAATATHWDNLSLAGEMAQLPEQGVALGVQAADGLYGELYVGSLHSSLAQPNSYAAHMGYLHNGESFSMDVGVRYSSHMQLNSSMGTQELQGIGAHGIFNMGSLTLLGEYVATTDGGYVSESATALRPSAWNTELGYRYVLGRVNTTFAVGYQGSVSSLNAESPEDSFLAGVRMNLFPNSALSLELRRDSLPDQASDEAATVKFAVDF